MSQFQQTHLTAQAWDAQVAELPGAHVLQTWEWGQVKERFGWQPSQVIWQDEQYRTVAAALVLQRTIPLGGFAARLCVLYVPKGPLLDWSNLELRRRVLNDLKKLAHQRGAIFIKIDPEVAVGTGIPGQSDALENPLGQAVAADLQQSGWHLSHEQVQFRNTVLVDLSPAPETLLANMKQKTRYNLRLAERKGVTVRVGGQADLAALYRLYAQTSVRDGFVIRDEAYYMLVWKTFLAAGILEPLVAEVAGELAAAVLIFRFAGKAWYLYGMSGETHREKMPNHLLQWQAMLRARQAGCRVYDLWGAPDEFDQTDALWGVYRFKEGLGGVVQRGLGAWDLPTRPLVYRLYTQILPRLLDIMRRRGKDRTRQVVAT